MTIRPALFVCTMTTRARAAGKAQNTRSTRTGTWWFRRRPSPRCGRTASFRCRCPRRRRPEAVAFGDLAALADVKAWLQTGVNAFPATDDVLLGRLITAASQFIVSWLGRPIAAADYFERRDGDGGHRLQFGCFPVSAVLSLTIDDVIVPSATNTWAAGYSFSPTQLSVRGY